jgi:peptidoglycan/xylan/chitin deacetylase (PgdA/CDA1 family)
MRAPAATKVRAGLVDPYVERPLTGAPTQCTLVAPSHRCTVTMVLRPLAVSVVLAAALVGTSVIHDGGAAVSEPGSGSTAGGGTSVVVPTPSASSSPAGEAPAGAPAPAPSNGPGSAGGQPPGTAAATRFAVWRHGARERKLVALTFDDGWNGDYVRRIVRILEAKRAPATFFPVARAVLRHPVTWREIAAAGFPIGNHSWNHADLSRLTPGKAAADIAKATRAIERTIQADLFPAIRPPYGFYDAPFLKAAQGVGMRAVIMWDIDTSDWTGRPPRAIVRAALAAKHGAIIVMHTDKTNTIRALPKVIDGLRKRGFTLVTVGQLIGLPGDVPYFTERELKAFQTGR